MRLETIPEITGEMNQEATAILFSVSHKTRAILV
jgi:hypothetical protein